MKKLILKSILIISVIYMLFGINNVYASMADYTDEEADAQTKKSQQEWKKEQKEIVNKSTNNYLKSLSVEGYTLTPEFDKQIQEYNLKISKDIKEINIVANLDDEKATVKGNGKITLKDGQNECRVDVTAESGTVRTYIIKLNNEQESKKEEEQTVTQIENTTENTYIENDTTEYNKIENTDNIKNNNSGIKEKLKNNKFLPIIIVVLIIIIILVIKANGKNKHKGKRSK